MSVSADFTLPAGMLPKAPYQATLNGSSGVAHKQPVQGLAATGGSWSNGPNGVIQNPDLSVIWPTMSSWRTRLSADSPRSWNFLGPFRCHQHADQRIQHAQQCP